MYVFIVYFYFFFLVILIRFLFDDNGINDFSVIVVYSFYGYIVFGFLVLIIYNIFIGICFYKKSNIKLEVKK